jgi:hypothetical protein
MSVNRLAFAAGQYEVAYQALVGALHGRNPARNETGAVPREWQARAPP